MTNDEIEELKDKILYYQNQYYNSDNGSEISDSEYDALFDKLISEIGINDPFIKRIGNDNSSNFQKVKHIMPMGSQNKASKPEAFRDWLFYEPDEYFIVEYKMDGASLELQYVDGNLKHAVTRGDGYIGDDITKNALKMQGCVKNLPEKFTGGIRGEIVLDHFTFKTKYSDKANCRNAANGLMKRKDGVGCEDLTIVTYDVFEPVRTDRSKTEFCKLEFLERCGFNVVPFFTFDSNTREVLFNRITDFRDKLNISRKDDYNFDIDGIVIKHVDCEKYENDSKEPKPKHQIAYKFSLDEAETTLIGIDWSISGSKRTPVAICNPVELCGTTVSRASLCNVALIKSLGLKIGSKVIMVKRGEIIPKLERVIYTPENATDIKMPDICEFCGSKLILNENETFLQCQNPKCPETSRYRIYRWIDINGIKGIGYSTIEELQRIGIRLNTILDLYQMSLNEMVSKGFSEVLGSKLLLEIEKSKSTSLAKFITGFSLDGIGLTTIETILNQTGISTWEEYRELKLSDLQSIEGVGDITAHLIIDSLNLNLSEMDELFKLMCFETNKTTSSELNGMTICITGNTEVTKDKGELKNIIRSAGGNVTESVTKSTTHLVCNDPNSTSKKTITAKKLGIPIITEKYLLSML